MDDQLVWRKATASGGEGGDCLEVADLSTGGRAVRDSKDPLGPWLRFTESGWSSFVAGIQAGQFD